MSYGTTVANPGFSWREGHHPEEENKSVPIKKSGEEKKKLDIII